MSVLTPAQRDALLELDRALGPKDWVLVGATALAWWIPMRWRRTQDLDVTISVSLDEWSELPARLEGWTPARDLESSWTSPSGARVDFIPAGPALLAAGSLTWPRSGRTLNLQGLGHAFDRGVPAVIAPGVSIRITPVPVIALLKAIAYTDRPHERERDLADLAYILEEYPPLGDERRYSEEFRATGMDFEVSGCFVLGREIRGFASLDEQGALAGLLRAVREENDGGLARATMLKQGPRTWNHSSDSLLERIIALEAGLDGSTPSRTLR